MSFDVECGSVVSMIGANLARCSQFNLWPHMSVLENVVEAPRGFEASPGAMRWSRAMPACGGRTCSTRRANIRDEVLAVMRDLADDGTTMIVVTHEMVCAREVSDQVMFLHNGLIVEQGPPSDLFGAPRSERLRQFLAMSLGVFGTASAVALTATAAIYIVFIFAFSAVRKAVADRLRRRCALDQRV